MYVHVHVCAVWAIADIVPIHVCTYMYVVLYVACLFPQFRSVSELERMGCMSSVTTLVLEGNPFSQGGLDVMSVASTLRKIFPNIQNVVGILNIYLRHSWSYPSSFSSSSLFLSLSVPLSPYLPLSCLLTC